MRAKETEISAALWAYVAREGLYYFTYIWPQMEHFGAVFKLDLTEETRMQLQEDEAIASSCLILATSVVRGVCV